MQLPEIRKALRSGENVFVRAVGFRGYVRIVDAKKEMGALKVKTATDGSWIIPYVVTVGD